MDLTVSSYRAQQPAFKAHVQKAVYGRLAEAGKECGRMIIDRANKESLNLSQLGSNRYKVNDFFLRTVQDVEKIRLAIEKHAKALPDSITIEMDPRGFVRYGLEIDNVQIRPIEVDSIVNTGSCTNDLDRFKVFTDAISTDNVHFKPSFIVRRFIDRIMESEGFDSVNKAREAAKRFAEQTGYPDYYYRASGENPEQILKENEIIEAEKQAKTLAKLQNQIKKANNNVFDKFLKSIDRVTKPNSKPIRTYLRPVEKETAK